MNNLALQSLTESIAIKYFGKAFKHEVYYNKRLRTTGGRYILSSHNIEINPKQYEMFGEKAVIDIIKHELCHYFLHLSGEGYQHRDKAFKILSAKVGAPYKACESGKNALWTMWRCFKTSSNKKVIEFKSPFCFENRLLKLTKEYLY